MKTKIFALVSALLLSGSVIARNQITTVAQVNESVVIDTEIDYVISGETPFGTMGSVNITSTEHAVVIIEKVRPSDVIKNLMSHIFINGEAAIDGTNCQVRMFNRGAIILPYDKNFKPLTCFTEENFGGDSYNGYTEGSSGGFMKTMNATNLNNRVKSFKLKRGYMVTLATGESGWGYSRCFIADLEDLEINVPAPLNGKASSYRLFKWWNASKSGVHGTNKEMNRALHTTSCFDWAQGNASLLPDQEWVPNHIYEDWPSAATCGSVTGSCHMKTNNEPGNSSDDHPQDVETVLNNWQNLMRTGMRLCSESSHDGSMNHLKQFINAIDERGWRCDILDLHGYWDGQWNSLDWYISEYGKGRPCWFSEWIWGSSWGNNGAFAEGRRSDDATYNGTVPILQKLIANKKVERFFYWNDEQWYTKIYRDGALTKLGRYYADMETGLAYNPANEYIPKIVYTEPSELTGIYTKKTNTMDMTWSDSNGDMIDFCVLEVKRPGSSKYVAVDTIPAQDQIGKAGATYTISHQPDEPGLYTYHIVEYANGSKKYTTNDVSCTVSAANAVGQLQYGQIKVGDFESITTDIEPQEVAPYVVMGMITNRNTANGMSNQIQTLSKGSFKFRLNPWTQGTAVTISRAEDIDYMVLPADTVMHINDDFMLISAKAGYVKGTEVSVTFPEAFPEGVTPVVVAQQNYSSATAVPTVIKVYDITNTGFKMKLVRQEAITTTFSQQNVNYFAATSGQISIGGGKMLTVGVNPNDKVYQSGAKEVNLVDANGEQMSFYNPFIIAAPQTNNYEKTSVFRIATQNKTNDAITSLSIKRQVDGTSTSNAANNETSGDLVGWFIISDDPNGNPDDEPVIDTPTAITTTKADLGFWASGADGMINAEGNNLKAYNANGQQVAIGKKVPAGIYVVTNGKQSTKIVVR